MVQIDWYCLVELALCESRYTSAAEALKPAFNRPCLIVSTREGDRQRGWDGAPDLCWSSATGNDWTEEEEGPGTCGEGWGASLIEQRREQSETPALGSLEGGTTPSLEEELEERGKESSSDPTGWRER